MSNGLSIRQIAAVLGGDVISRTSCNVPGPGHSKSDRSLTVMINREGLVVHSHAGDDWRACKDFVRGRLGLSRHDGGLPQTAPKVERLRSRQSDGSDAASWLWRRRQPIGGTVAERYLRKVRGYQGAIPATVGFLAPSGAHGPAMIAAFGFAVEAEPGILSIQDRSVRGVHLTRLTTDGNKVPDTPKKMLGSSLSFPIVLAPPNDLLGLAITEGIEDALSVHEATGLGVWAAGSANRMPTLAERVPTYVECVNIYVDENEAGRTNAEKLAALLYGRTDILMVTPSPDEVAA